MADWTRKPETTEHSIKKIFEDATLKAIDNFFLAVLVGIAFLIITLVWKPDIQHTLWMMLAIIAAKAMM